MNPYATAGILQSIATIGLSIGAIVLLTGQCRKPWGWAGRVVIWLMNLQHTAVTTWGLSHVSISPEFVILDVGCGGGKTIRRLAASASAGKVFGIDYSPTSVAAAKRLNAGGVASGHVSIQQASVSRLPFPDNTFDLVSAVETHYYWPDPARDVREILRVLKPGGSLVLIAEAYRSETRLRLLAIPMKLLGARYLTAQQHEELFLAAGFTDVAIEKRSRKGWICVAGRKSV